MFRWVLKYLGLISPYKKLQLGASDHRFQEECPVCQEALGLTICYEIKKCGHLYHKNCIQTWCKIKKNCPLCRTAVVPVGWTP